MSSAAEFIFSTFSPLINSSEPDIMQIGTVIPIPKFDPDDFLELCRDALNVFKKQPHVLKLEPPVYILGDIHGDLHDLLRVLSKIKDSFESCKVLLLGDYIDRGGYSTEVVLLLFSLITQYPNNFFMLRGNHEFANLNGNSNVLDTELNSLYGKTPLFTEIHTVFTYLPLAAVIGDEYFCVHGGLSEHLKSVADIEKVEYPVVDLNEKLVEDLLWSDPCNKITGFLDSTRGRGVLFGNGAVQQFLEDNKFKKVIRAHQCVINGVSLFYDSVITVFTTSFYNAEENKGAFIMINRDFEILQEILSPLKPLKRAQAFFANAQKSKNVDRTIAKSLIAAQSKTVTGRCVKPPLARPRANHMINSRGLNLRVEKSCGSIPIQQPVRHNSLTQFPLY
ncbi:Serine/threonine-protein phosphatase PP1-2 [Tritrichomonas foetus]|uniref:Serine/threonine-protein phosphatase n=1 Tax=Tritrichomonas foetus TaxID=1144522 RepID=A0A1J4JE88_9EUKA|nr:Serine/threonine-protein phosphatase PP1-2 [Tritrichomonas foetus]|eukprot:OHS97424.1 Serine/threonine-protein phosphatase PP1-2 [Tritrichomonas foetus]